MKQEETQFECHCCSSSILKAEGCKFCDASDRIFKKNKDCFKKDFLNSPPVCHWLDREIVLPQNGSVRLVWMLKQTEQCFDIMTEPQCLHFLFKPKIHFVFYA